MKKKKKSAFPAKVAKPRKSTLGRTAAAETPLHVRTSGLTLDEETEARVRERIQRKLVKFAPSIERISVRLRDVNGPKGGIDTTCTIKVVLSGNPSVVVEEVHEDIWRAVVSSSDAVERGVRRILGRRGSRKGVTSASNQRAARSTRANDESDGSRIGRRVGRSSANLRRAAARPEKQRRDALVDTAEPGRSETDRRVGATSTATRNTKLNRAGLTSTLEDSESGTPSRKSTRRSANRSKRDSNLQRRQTRALTAPKARSARAKAKGKGGGRKPK